MKTIRKFSTNNLKYDFNGYKTQYYLARFLQLMSRVSWATALDWARVIIDGSLEFALLFGVMFVSFIYVYQLY